MNSLFGLDFTQETADIYIVPACWELSVSYRYGTSKAPLHILQSSYQLDLYHPAFNYAQTKGIFMPPINNAELAVHDALCQDSRRLIKLMDKQGALTKTADLQCLEQLNHAHFNFLKHLETQITTQLKQGKLVGLLGGEHSVTEAAILAMAKQHPSFGILQLDAHMDLRKCYQGFQHSHASVMHNCLNIPQLSNLVQVGIRDSCIDEQNIARNDSRISVFSNYHLKKDLFEGRLWSDICDEIVSCLPEKVYISFDIDALEACLCPDTGTPVVGGLGFDEVFYLISKIVAANKKIIGFDLVEVAGQADQLSCMLGARALYQLAGYASLGV